MGNTGSGSAASPGSSSLPSGAAAEGCHRTDGHRARVPRARAPKEKPKAEVVPKPRQAPTDEAQRAAAAALARLELKPKGKAPCSSQETIKNQGRNGPGNRGARGQLEKRRVRLSREFWGSCRGNGVICHGNGVMCSPGLGRHTWAGVCFPGQR